MRRLLAPLIAIAAVQVAIATWFRRSRNDVAGDRHHFIATLGGSSLKPSADDIADSVASVLMGGLVLDLRETQLAEVPAKIDLLAVMGGVFVVVPAEWKVVIDVQPIMGGTQDIRNTTPDPERPIDLHLTGRVIMGGLGVGTEHPNERTHKQGS